MKKALLLFITLLTATISAWAITDGQTYPEVNGIKIVNKWIFDRVHSGTAYTSNAICNQRARTATMDQGIIYVSRSEERAVIIGTDTISQSIIHRFSAEDGSQLEDLPLTLNGAPYGRFLGVASIGRDSFHHIWVAPMTSTAQQYVPVYLVNTETGELTLVVEMDKGDAPQRTDYLDVIGDITREQAECNIMTVSGSTADPGFPTLYRMHADQGGDWEGGFDGDPYMDVINFYPETKTGFSLAPVIKMIEGADEDSRYSGEMFYIDCFDTAPVIYDFSGSVIDSFEDTDPTLWPQSQPNGCIEFKLEDRNFLVYVNADMNGNGHGCQANICELGEGMSLGGMTKYWTVPADSLGKVNDSGLRVHCFAVDYGVDDEGYEEVTLFTFKAYNGMAIYKIGRNVDAGGTPPSGNPGDVNGDGEVNIADVNALIDMILSGQTSASGDVNSDGEVNIADVNAVIAIILGS
ncbi:MAG: dockerin type I repeat-containing protein [Muribaculaceae bacterium]|nr:dockerin type I repeat-containing protein [Muribaculaceae bacterium]MBR5684574.1 dockerin type I repeat-containing protein [Muribaculaceae bacterium]